MKWFLGGPIRLAILPGFLIGIVQVAHIFFPYLGGPFPFFPYMLVFIFGFTMAATDEDFTKNIMKKYRWIYFFIGVLLCLLFGILNLGTGIEDRYTPPTTIILKICSGLCRGSGQWLFLIGSVALAREKFTTSSDRLKLLREMAMPFYLVHQQVLVSYLVGALWVPYLRSLPITIILGTLLTTLVAFLITKAGPLRYFFGLAPPKKSFLPGKYLRGFVPTLIMSALVICHIIIANVL